MLLKLISEQLGIEYISLKQYPINQDILRKLPEIHARRFRAIALAEENGQLLVGMADPSDIFAYDEINKVLNQPTKIAAISENDLFHHLDTGYRKTEQIDNLAEVLDDELSDTDFDLQALTQTSNSNDAPVVKLLQAIFEDAVNMKASDIHIEPDSTVLRIRQRIDGVLQEQIVDETRIASALSAWIHVVLLYPQMTNGISSRQCMMSIVKNVLFMWMVILKPVEHIQAFGEKMLVSQQ